MNCSPNALLAASVQYRSLTKSQLRSSIIYLLCEWANHLAPPFRWTPEALAMTWRDASGIHSTDYPTFVATADIATVNRIDAGGLGATSFENLSSLPALVELFAGFNPGLTTIDASGCSSLVDISCDNCNLTSLNVTGCTSLVTLNCYFNFALATITGLTTCTSLQTFDCDNCALTSLNCSGLAALTTLNCSSNASLTTLTLTGCTALVTLDCNSCAISSMPGIATCTNLVSFDFQTNQMTTMDAHTLTSLDFLDGHSNLLTSVNVTGCTLITRLVVAGNQLTTLDTSTLPILDILNCSDNLLTALDLTSNLMLTDLAVNGNNLGSTGILNISTCTALLGLSCYDNPNMVSLDLSPHSVMSILDCHNCGLTSLKMGGSSGYLYVDASNNSLPTGPNGVDSVLSDLNTNCLANSGTCDLNTPATNASPTGGLLNADYVALTGAGWTVSIN